MVLNCSEVLDYSGKGQRHRLTLDVDKLRVLITVPNFIICPSHDE